MTTKTLTRCFRFTHVDFVPDMRLLIWNDKTETPLTVHESRLLETLCLSAGEVINAEPLYHKTFTQIDPYEDDHNNQYDLNTLCHSLQQKLTRGNKVVIPIDVIRHYGFRVPLPVKTCRIIHESKTVNALPAKPVSPTSPSNSTSPKKSPAENIVNHSIMHKISVVILTIAGAAVIYASFN
ncbi:hypothetical protein ABT56_17670 [Photobacterium aquae]|uniref:OmpR/PhoB-type domain-containing protein n=1 Tax=Photobacterium aquae TaxID=1195763 RepID=A0A0J1JNJ3_9GAMM|nr:hypothetical protein [Photobacterium aquae]KLV03802.1 hypothetical protein ABT56_17670 [Photobacterium aquae]